MSIATQTLSAAKAVLIVISIAIAIFLGFVFAVYLSLRSSEVQVPDVVGKDRFVAENELTGAGLNFRVRAIRPSNQVKADSIIFQLPRAGDVVKAGQTVAVDVSRPAKEGEASETISHEDNANTKNGNENTNESSSPGIPGILNENKPKRKTIKNTNGNANGNANTGNRNANSNRPKPNVNANSGNANSNRRANGNAGEANNQNSNRPNRNVNRATPPAHTTPPK